MNIDIRIDGKGEQIQDLLATFLSAMEEFSDADWADFVDHGWDYIDNDGGFITTRVPPEKSDYLVTYAAYQKGGRLSNAILDTSVVTITGNTLPGNAIPGLREFCMEEAQKINPKVNHVVILEMGALDQPWTPTNSKS